MFGFPQSEYSLPDAVERRVGKSDRLIRLACFTNDFHPEPPLQRYSRLRVELEQLKFDLDGVVQSESQQSASIYSLLQSETNALVSAARTLEGSDIEMVRVFLENKCDPVSGHKGLELLKRTISTSDKVLEQLVDSVKSISIKGE